MIAEVYIELPLIVLFIYGLFIDMSMLQISIFSYDRMITD